MMILDNLQSFWDVTFLVWVYYSDTLVHKDQEVCFLRHHEEPLISKLDVEDTSSNSPYFHQDI